MKISDWIEIGRFDDLGRLETPLRNLDARTKILTTLLFIVLLLSFPRYEISALTPFLIYPLVLTSLGRIPPGLLLKRIMLVAPFAFLVLVFNPLLDPQRTMLAGIVPVSAGWLSLVSGMLKFVLCVGAALILLASTGMPGLCAGLGRLGLPKVFVVQILFLHRYLHVIAAEALSVLRAASLRMAGRKRLRFGEYASLLGHLLIRSLDRASRVYQAMLARGFKGEIHLAHPGNLRREDFVFAGAWVLFFALARSCNLAEEVGRIIVQLV